MSVKLISDYYIKRKPKLMEQFDKFLGIAKEFIVKQFSESKAEELIKQMKDEYETLIPEIPYIGGRKNPFTSMLVDCVATLAIFRILEKAGLTYREIGEFNNEFWEKISRIRKYKLEKAGQNPVDQYFNDTYVSYTKKLSETSRQKKYPFDWVMEFVEGDGKTFDYGFKITECGTHKVFKKLGAEKYVPFICLTDFALANKWYNTAGMATRSFRRI